MDAGRCDVRTEFGAQRTTCACKICITNCRYMPGFLIPADLDRLIPVSAAGVTAVLRWANENLLASPGALIRIKATGEITRVPTLVPATKPDGSCIHLSDDHRCTIHENAPFGCAFFDCRSGADSYALSAEGVIQTAEAHRNRALYSLIWTHLYETGRRQQPAEVLQNRLRNTEKL